MSAADTAAAGVAIAPIAVEDRVEWERLWRAYLAFYGATVDAEMYDIAFERLLSGADGEVKGFLARRSADGAALGLVHYLYHRHGWRRGPVCYLQDLFVDETARGGQVGRRLIEAVYAAADADGAEDVYWLTQDFNATARRLYDRIGQVTPFIKYTRG